MGKLALRGLALAVVIGLLGVGSYAIAGGGTKNFNGSLEGYQENVDVSTGASGSFEAQLSNDGTSLHYELSYSGIEGGTVSAAHVHFGKPGVNGGVSYFLCGGGGRPACTTPSGTFEGDVVAADVIGPAGQGIAAGEFDEILAAMRAGHAYANVHSTPAWPGGEIRGQINDRGDDD
jgi:hypothetical protein